MELKAKQHYRGVGVELKPGHTTEGRDEFDEARKEQMYRDFPEMFDVVGADGAAGDSEDSDGADAPVDGEVKPAGRKGGKK